MQAEKITWGHKSLFSLWFQRLCDDKPIFDFGIFCHLLRLMGISGGEPRRSIWKVSFSRFFSSFSFLFFFFSILRFLFSLSLEAPLAPGPLDIVHPCHPVATPLSLVFSQVLSKFDVYHDCNVLLRYLASRSFDVTPQIFKDEICKTSLMVFLRFPPPAWRWYFFFTMQECQVVRSLHGSATCGESLNLAALWMKTLPNRSNVVQVLLLKTTDLEIIEYHVMLHPYLFDCQFKALPANSRPCKGWIDEHDGFWLFLKAFFKRWFCGKTQNMEGKSEFNCYWLSRN